MKTHPHPPNENLPGRDDCTPVTNRHYVLGHPLMPPFPPGHEMAMFGLGCFWGAERRFWQVSGVYSTAVGYAGGNTPHASYQEVCSGRTGHSEVVRVIYDPALVSYEALLKIFWEAHDPTQGMRQGNDVGTQYRSGIYPYTTGQQQAAEGSRARYQEALHRAGRGRCGLSRVRRLPPGRNWQHLYIRRLRPANLRAGCAASQDNGAANLAHWPAWFGIHIEGRHQLPRDRQSGDVL